MHRGLVGCPIVLQVVGRVWGVNGWQQFQVCLVCQRKAGGDTGRNMVAGGKRGSLCAGVSCVSFLSIGC